MTPSRLSLDVFVDVVCPWCFIGEKRLRQALSSRPGLPVDVRFRAFLLQPGTPERGTPAAEFFRERFGSMDRVKPIWDRVREAGRPDGIEFAFEKQAVISNSLKAHRVVKLLSATHDPFDVLEAMFSAHFEEGQDVGDEAVLMAALAKRLPGLDVSALRERLAKGEAKAEVEADLELARRLGVSGVPFFVGNGRVAVSGAQPAEVIAEFLDQAAQQAPRSLD